VQALAEPGLNIEGATRERAVFESVFALPIEFAAVAQLVMLSRRRFGSRNRAACR